MDNFDDETPLPILEALKQAEERENEYTAVLGASDDKNCSYPSGYVKRQALYACLTCTPDAKLNPDKRAGVCLACSLKCHDNHNLVELYTKRNFRCDCGNSKMQLVKCELVELKDSENMKNTYNQNYSGLYCTCHRPHPDPDCEQEDAQIQCIICEDWYHEGHLNVNGTIPTNYSEMICGTCMDSLPFLKLYDNQMVTNSEDLDASSMSETKDESINVTDVCESKDDNLEEPKPKKLKIDECKRPTVGNGTYQSGASFWKDEWRNQLCRCDECSQMYSTLNISYLLDPEDTVDHYERIGKEKEEKAVREFEEQALSSMDRVSQIEFIHGVNKFKDRLGDFFRSFGENHVITEADVKKFFAEMQQNDRKDKDNYGNSSTF